MARVPGPTNRQIFSQIPDVVDTGAGSAFAALAHGISVAASVAKPLATQEAAQQGAEAVFRAADGSLQADTRIPFTEMDGVFNEAARAIYVQEIEGEITNRIQTLAFENQGNPDGFRSAAAAYRNDVVRSAPAAFRGDVSLIAGKRLNAAHTRLVGDHLQETHTRALISNEAALERNARAILELSATPSAENDERIKDLQAERQDLLSWREQFPGSRWTAESSLNDQETLGGKSATARDRAQNALFEEQATIFKSGYTPESLDAAKEALAGTEYEGRLAVYEKAHKENPEFALLPPADQKALLDAYGSAGVNADEVGVYDIWKEIHEDTVSAMQKDPIAFAEARSPEIFSGPVDISNPDSIRARVEVASELSNSGNNPSGRIFTNAEIEQLGEMMKSGDASEKMVVLNGIAATGASWHRAAKEIGLTSVQSHITGMIRHGYPPSAVASAVSGMSVSGGSGPHKNYAATVQEEVLTPYLEAQEFGSTGAASAFTDQTLQVATLIFKDRMQTAGVKPDDDGAKEIWTQSLKAATGAVGTVGGYQQVNGYGAALPAGMDSVHVNKAFQSLRRTYLETVPNEQENRDFDRDALRTLQGGASRSQRESLRVREEERAGAAREQSEALRKRFWEGVSISGGQPVLDDLPKQSGGFWGRLIASDDAVSGMRIIAYSNREYGLSYFNGGEWLPVRDSKTDGLFIFDINQFAQRGMY